MGLCSGVTDTVSEKKFSSDGTTSCSVGCSVCIYMYVSIHDINTIWNIIALNNSP